MTAATTTAATAAAALAVLFLFITGDKSLVGAQLTVDDVIANITLLQAGQAALQQENDKLKKDNNMLATEVSGLTAEVTGLRSYNNQLKTEVTDFKSGNSQLKTEISGLKTENSQLKTEISGLKKANSQLRTEVSGLNSEVSQLETEISALTKDNGQLRAEVSGLNTEVSSLKNNNSHLRTDISGLCTKIGGLENDNGRFRSEVSGLNENMRGVLSETSVFRQRIQALKDLHSKRIIFHAQLKRFKPHPTRGDVYISEETTQVRLTANASVVSALTQVYINQGGAYSSSTGVFTVPVTGTYFFTATTGADWESGYPKNYARLNMMVDTTIVCHIYSKSVDFIEQHSCSYAGHLRRGQRVWLRPFTTNGIFLGHITTFTGFLVSAD